MKMILLYHCLETTYNTNVTHIDTDSIIRATHHIHSVHQADSAATIRY